MKARKMGACGTVQERAGWEWCEGEGEARWEKGDRRESGGRDGLTRRCHNGKKSETARATYLMGSWTGCWRVEGDGKMSCCWREDEMST
jgi:hypothetical protein